MVSYYCLICGVVTYGLSWLLYDISLPNPSDLDFNLSRSLRKHTIGLTIYAFLLMFNSNIWPNSVPLRDKMLQNLNDLDFDLSRSNLIVSLNSSYMLSY